MVVIHCRAKCCFTWAIFEHTLTHMLLFPSSQEWKCLLCEDPVVAIEEDVTSLTAASMDGEPKTLSNVDQQVCWGTGERGI